MYRIRLRHVYTTQKANLYMTREAAEAIRDGDVFMFSDGPLEWRVTGVEHMPMSLGGLKTLHSSLKRVGSSYDPLYKRVDEWNLVVVGQELQLTEKELLG